MTGSPPTPPVSRSLLKILLPAEIRDEVLRELEERFEKRVDDGWSPSRARSWYRGQALRAIIPALRTRLPGGWPAGQTGGFGPAGTSESQGSRARGWKGGRALPGEGVARDALFALAQLRRNPGFSLLVVLTLALGIGTTTSVFSLVDAALFRPLPYRNADRVMVIRGDRTLAETNSPFMSGPDLTGLRHDSRTLSAVAAFSETLVGPLTEVEHPVHVKTVLTSADFFQVLGVDAALGRVYSLESLSSATADTTMQGVAVLSHDLWVRSYGADPGIVGRIISVWGRPLLVSGVLPEGFRLRLPPDFATAEDIEVYQTQEDDYSEDPPDWWWARVVARLGPGTTVGAAAAELESLAETYRGMRAANADHGTHFRVTAVSDAVRGPLRTTLSAFVVAVMLVFLIACTNVANLLLVRGTTRLPELAIRSALGAGRGRILRQLLTETGTLSILGAALGLWLAFALVRVVSSGTPVAGDLSLDALSPDLRILTFAVVMAITTTLLAGLVPSLSLTRRFPVRGFQHRGGIGGRHRFNGALAVAQVALSMTLLVGVGLMFRTISELQNIPLGFNPTGILTATTTQSLRGSEERTATEEALLAEVSALPGVEAAGVVFPLPMNGVYQRTVRFVDERFALETPRWRDAYFRTMSPGYLEAMEIGVISGRGFGREDETDENPVAIVDEVLAGEAWPGEDPIGKRIRAVGMGGNRDSLSYRVVGVVEYVPQWDHRDAQPTIYFPRAIYLSHEVSLAVRVAGDPLALAIPLREAIQRVEVDLPADVMPITGYLTQALGPTRFVLVLLTVFAGVAVGLAGVGLYGVLAHGVRQRRKEIGVRMALGAERSAVLGGVAREAFRIAAIGLIMGTGGALILGTFLRAHLFQVGVADPAALLGTTAIIVIVVSLASWLPARNAAAVDPVEALRAD